MSTVKNIFKKQNAILVVVIIVLSVVFGSVNKNFYSWTNITNVMRQMSALWIASVGVFLALLLGGIDLSIGSVVGVSSVFAATWILNLGLLPGIVLGLALCAFLGGVQGSIIAQFGIPAFIVTLGGQQILRGWVFVFTGGMPIAGLPEQFLYLATGYLNIPLPGGGNFGIPVSMLLAILIYILMHLMLTRTKFGRYLYAIGGNEEAAILSGIRVKRYKIAAHALASLMAGVAGLILTARAVTGQPTLGEGYELDCIAATVIGGTSFRGGEGTVVGTMLGCILTQIIRNGLNLMKVSSFYQMMVIGALIIFAVIADTLQKSKGKLR